MATPANASAETHSNSALLTKDEVAKQLQVSTRYIERQVKIGRLPALKLSHNLTRFRRADVDSFLESSCSVFLLSGKAGAAK
jgi:excisionase family DNA binding protein